MSEHALKIDNSTEQGYDYPLRPKQKQGQDQLLGPIQVKYQYKWKVPDTKAKTNLKKNN